MNAVLIIVLSLSVSGSILALILLALKPLIKNRLSQTWQYYIWLIVILRFLLPFTPQVSVVGEISRYIQNINGSPAALTEGPGIDVDEEYIISQAPDVPQPQIPRDIESSTPAHIWRDILNNAWLLWIGVALVLFVHKASSYQGFLRFVKVGMNKITDPHILDIYRAELEASKIKRKLPLYENNQVVSPMLVGIIRPALVIPALEASYDELRHIFRHEMTHYKRLDILYKWLVQITLCLHWFNPLMHMINKQINKSCELSCDEAVIKHLDEDGRITYGDALIASMKAQGNYSDFVVSMTMSENGNIVKERLDMIMSYKKKSWTIFCITILLTALLLCGFSSTGAYVAVGNTKTVNATESPNGIIYNHTGEIYTNDEWENFSVQRIGQATFQTGDTLSAHLAWDGAGEIMLLYTDINSTEEEVLVPIYGLSGVPKPDYDVVDGNNLGSVYNFKRASTSPLKWEEDIAPGTYWFYLIRFDKPGNIGGNVGRINSNDTIDGIWALTGRDASGKMISAYPSESIVTPITASQRTDTAVGITFGSTATLDAMELVATDYNITKSNVPAYVQEWIRTCDEKTGAYLFTQQTGGLYESYLYYNGGGRYPWSIEANTQAMTICFNFITDRMKGDEGYTIVKFQAPTKYDITLSIGDSIINVSQSDSAFDDIILEELAKSIEFDITSNELSLKIPPYSVSEQQISLQVTGRLFNHEDSMKLSWSPFMEAAKNGWQSGKTYTGTVQLQNVNYIEIAGSIKDVGSSTYSESFVVLINQTGNIIRCERVPADGEKDRYYQQVLK